MTRFMQMLTAKKIPLVPFLFTIFFLSLALLQQYMPRLMPAMLFFAGPALYLGSCFLILSSKTSLRFVKASAVIFFYTGLLELLYLVQSLLEPLNQHENLWIVTRIFFFSTFFLLALTRKKVSSLSILLFFSTIFYAALILIHLLWPQLFLQFQFKLYDLSWKNITPVLLFSTLGLVAFLALRNPPHVAAPWPLSFWNTAFFSTLVADVIFFLGSSLFSITLALLLKSASGLVFFWSFQRMIQGQQPREKQRQANNTNQLARTFSHEMNNLLYGISLNLELSSQEIDGQKPVADYIQQASLAQHKAALQNQKILSILQLSSQDCQNIQLADWLVQNRQELEDHSECTIHLQIPAKLKQTLIYGDKSQIATLMEELLQNAKAAMQEPEPIEIRLDHEMKQGVDYLLLEIKNPAMNFNPNKALTPFYSSSATGLGLGLTYVQQVMQIHQGLLELKADPDWAIVKCYFPLREE